MPGRGGWYLFVLLNGFCFSVLPVILVFLFVCLFCYCCFDVSVCAYLIVLA